MSICIVTHCYAEKLPQYAAFLKYHLSSLILNPPSIETEICVCWTSSDKATEEVLDWYFRQEKQSNVKLTEIDLLPERLFRRSIGRNLIALENSSSLVWFTDVDYVFGPGCIDAVWMEFNRQQSHASMMYPQQMQIHKNHEIGNAYALRLSGLDGLMGINASDFEDKSCNRAFGGIQIVPGSLARKHGYLADKAKWQQTTDIPFGDFRDDVAYRKACQKHGPIIKIDVPNLYRLRHTKTTYQKDK